MADPYGNASFLQFIKKTQGVIKLHSSQTGMKPGVDRLDVQQNQIDIFKDFQCFTGTDIAGSVQRRMNTVLTAKAEKLFKEFRL